MAKKSKHVIEVPGKLVWENEWASAGLITAGKKHIGLLINSKQVGKKMPTDFLGSIKQSRVSSVSMCEEFVATVRGSAAELMEFAKRVASDEKQMKKEGIIGGGDIYLRHFSSDLCFVLVAKGKPNKGKKL